MFEVKARPSFDPLIVHVARTEDVGRIARGRGGTGKTDPRVAVLAERFWPGPLTLVLKRQPSVPELVTAGLDTVGVRVPAHPAARELIRGTGTPVAAPSANPFGYVSPTRADHVVAQLGGTIDLILDGGPCPVGLESTILSLAADPPLILRPGAITREQLEATLGTPLEMAGPTARPSAPGQLPRHYATRTPLRILDGPAGPAPARLGRVGLLALIGSPDASGYAALEILAPDGTLTTAAANLFAALRRLDGAGLDLVLAEPCPEDGIGRAIMDRLRRCAAPR